MLSAAVLPHATAQGSLTDTAIASENGLTACTRAVRLMQGGGDTLDAAIAGVNLVEEDPNDNTVGYGGLPNEDGVVQLDASVMHGPSRRCGAVAAIEGIKTPSKIARLIMTETDHVLLVGEGAARFARVHGFEPENLLTDRSRQAWLAWKKSRRDSDGHNNWSDGLDAPLVDAVRNPPTGTINLLTLNRRGEMSGVTSTSGLAWKIAGRVGDSPIPGAGVWVDQDVGAAGSTGRGEENIRIAGAHTVVENMRRGMTARDACLEALKRVVRNFNNDEKRLAAFDLNFYALRKDGDYAAAALWNGRWKEGKLVRRHFAVDQGGRSRLEESAYLFERRSA